MFKVPEQYRYHREGSAFNSTAEVDKNNGFFVMIGPYGRELVVIASDGLGWEHVSVSLKKGIPAWEEMGFVKDLFWDKEDCVVQFHPPASKYVDNYDALHMWRKVGSEFETPDEILVGIKEKNAKV